MRSNQKGFVPVLVIIVVAVLAAAGYFMFVQKEKLFKSPNQEISQSVGQIDNNSGLDTASNDLDGTDMNQFDSQLDQISSDASSF